MVKKLDDSGYPKELLTETAEYYTAQGFSDTVAFLTRERGLPEPQARELVRSMEQEDIRLNREVLLFYSIIGFIFAFVLGIALWSESYLFSIIPAFFLIRSLRRIIRFVRSHQLARSQ